MTTKIKTPGITDANVTTDKLNLISTSGTPGATIKGTSGQTDGYLQLNCEENTHGIKLKSPPHSAAQSYTLTFPQSITNGYFLKTDGSGNLSFAEVNVDDTAWQSSIVTAATLSAVVGYGYWIDTTSNACTITLPGSANVGDQIIFVDYARTWATNAVTINQNSLNFQGNTSPNPVYNTNGQTVNIVYSGATKGWIPISDDDVTNETIQTYSVDFLVVAGGGSGGSVYNAGGGGAGGYRTSTQTVNENTAITVTVGDGGATSGLDAGGNSGSNSSISGTGFTTITSTGGGGAGARDSAGANGGSGGGGSSGSSAGAGGSGNTPSTSPSQGNDGGDSIVSGPSYGGGGGGGAGAVGADATTSAAGNGGAGTASSITGSSVTRAGGGGGNAQPGVTAGSGGTGGGGAGNSAESGTGTSGTANTGGGGGGARANGTSGAGGKGVVILSMADADYSGTTSGSPTVATGVSGKTILTFTGTGSYTT